MKKIIYILLAGMLIGLTSLNARELSGAEAQRTINGAEKIRMGETSNIPEYVQFRIGAAPQFSQFQNWMNSHFRLPAGTGFKVLSTETDRLGFTHTRYQQTFKGIIVEGTMYVLHIKNNLIVSMNGLLFDNLNITPTPTLDKATALSHALEYTNATKYRWQVSAWEEQIKKTNNNASATWYPQGELVYAPQNGNYKASEYRLCYKFDIYAEQPLSRNFLFVDAVNGTIIYKQNRIHDGNSIGTVVTAYSGTQTITTDSVNATNFRLRETGRGQGIETYNLQGGNNYASALDFIDADNNWNNINAQLDQYAGDAHWGAEMTYDFYFVNFNRNSIDNAGFKLYSYVHYNQNFVNAFWDGTEMTYGDGDNTYTPLTSLDITGHEITHGLTEKTSNLGNVPEGGAMNEGFSDCMGNAIRQYGKQSANIDWLIGDEIGGAPFRNMQDPKATGNPDTYFGTNWDSVQQEVHQNSTILSHSFYLVSEGGFGTNDNGDAYNVDSMGLTAASAIWFRMNTVYLTPNSNYADARYYSIQAATDLFGPCSPEVIATVDAWHAVGVGAAYIPGVSSNFTAPVTSFCQAPATASFTNLSNNGASFFWDFGDGNTSTLLNPTHTYANYGDYDVKLVADGGTCGIDSILKTTYISVQTVNPCVVTLPLSGGVGVTQTACSGQLFDNGGPSANYTDNITSSITISPTGASTVTLTFSLFDLESNYDYLYIYDGATTTSPLIGQYTGNTLPPAITSTYGSVTIRQTSDQALNFAGFALGWQCQLSTVPPTVDFSVNSTSSCSGVINFIDQSTDGPTTWFWDFGDGNTSTQQNPSHIYLNNGTYTVGLIATNANGSDSLTKTNYITINIPVAPTGVGVSVCAGVSANLSASGAGTLTWFDVPVGGTPLGTGPVFATPIVTANSTFYVESDVFSSPQHNGPIDNTFGTGTNYVNNTYRCLIFDCFAPTRLTMVKVYAQGAGNRTITLMDNTGVLLQSATINIPDGMSYITLNFDLPVGTGLELGATGGVNLFRNNSGAIFPYTLSGVVSITGNNAGGGATDYYYFFYDWVLQDACASPRTPVIVSVIPTPTTLFGYSFLTNVVTFYDNSLGGATSWFWTFGDGATSTFQNPVHTYPSIGNFTVTLTTSNGVCSNTVSQVITLTTVGINDPQASELFSVFPNPVKNSVVVNVTAALQKDALRIELTNTLGQTVMVKKCKTHQANYTLDVSKLPAGIYAIALTGAEKTYLQKLVKQ